jgi:hypothetical protein
MASLSFIVAAAQPTARANVDGRRRCRLWRWLVGPVRLTFVMFSLDCQVSNEGDKIEVTAELARLAVFTTNLMEGMLQP